MSLVINYNAASQMAQNNLRQTQAQLNQAIERLSSGRRINSAADDAAGLAIANRLTAQIRGLDQAAQNAGDGISLAQTTEGALEQINNNLQRIRELAVQAANGTNSQSNLNSIQAEIDARLAEIDRVANQTAFNGINLLDGSTDKISIQVGYKDGQTIEIDLQEVSAETLGLGEFNVNGFDLSGSYSTHSAAVGALTTIAASTALSASALNLEVSDAVSSVTYDFQGTGSGTLSSASLVKDTDGDLFAVVGSGASATVYAVTEVEAATTSAAPTSATVTLTVNNTQELTQATNGQLGTLDSALSEISEFRSDLGAIQNRFDSVINTINSTETNLRAAKSRIVNTNYAEAVSQLSQAKILNQAGTAVLAQANQTQKSVLSLLRNV